MEGKEEFDRQLTALGLTPRMLSETRTAIAFTVPVGTLSGRELTLGFEVPPDFPRTPPSGPHISPRIQPNNGANSHPDRVADSPFGTEWQYWSRPYPNWGRDGQTVSAYMAFVRHLFAQS